MNETQRLKLVLSELKRRGVNLAPKQFIDEGFPKQKELILDNSRFQAWNCTRRGGKSVTFAKKCVKKLWENPGTNALYLALTADSAKEILWKIVEEELDKNKIEYRTNETLKRFTLSNGSQLRFFGVDSSFKEMKKILGNKLIMVGIDEAGSMAIDMKTLCYQIIKPALSDLQGELVILGTCENIPNTFLEQVIKGTEEMSALWKRHVWTTYENPYMAEIHDKEIKEAIAINPKVVEASWFKTHYLNQWCANDELLIINFNPLINRIDKLYDAKWEYSLGVDLGFNDASAFVVDAFNRHDHKLYRVFAYKSSEMDLTDVSNMIKKLDQQYNFFNIVVDGANKQGIEEMQNRHGHRKPLKSADKTDKANFLRLMNDDYKQGNILELPGASALSAEQSSLMWLEGTDREDPRCDNHLNDAALYNWRACRIYLSEPVKKKETDIDYMNNYEKHFIERKRRERELNGY